MRAADRERQLPGKEGSASIGLVVSERLLEWRSAKHAHTPVRALTEESREMHVDAPMGPGPVSTVLERCPESP